MKEITRICTLERTEKSSTSGLDTVVCNPPFNRVNKRRIVVVHVVILFYDILLFYLLGYFFIIISKNITIILRGNV